MLFCFHTLFSVARLSESSAQDALGVPGVDGAFRLASERVLAELRGNGEMLTDLVASFVTDPLVEWSFVRDDSAASKVLCVDHSQVRRAMKITSWRGYCCSPLAATSALPSS